MSKYLLLLFLFLTACLLPSVSEGGEGVTRWKGSWTSTQNGHHGPVRVRLTPTGGNHYRGLFAGRFAVVIPYLYRADVYRYGNQLVSEKRLGPLGSYRMTLTQNGGGLSGGWTAGDMSGNISMQQITPRF